MDVPVTMADTNWRRLRGARLEGHNVFYGEVLSENADHRLDHRKFSYLIAVTPNDAYNSLVCVEFAPELGRHRVFQLSGQDKEENDPNMITFTSRGRLLATSGRTFDALTRDWWSGWRFRSTTLTEEYTMENMREDRADDQDILISRASDGSLNIVQAGQKPKFGPGSTVLTFSPSRDDRVTSNKPTGTAPSGSLPA